MALHEEFIGPQIPHKSDSKINGHDDKSSIIDDEDSNDKGEDTFTVENKYNTNPRLIAKLNHYFNLKSTKGLSLNQQLASHPDFHAPGITESLVSVLNIDPWGSNLSEDVARPAWDRIECEGDFNYVKVANDQRIRWESQNPQAVQSTIPSLNMKPIQVQVPSKAQPSSQQHHQSQSNQGPRRRI